MFAIQLIQKGLSLAFYSLRKQGHSTSKLVSHGPGMDVHVLSALSDNYMYLIVDKGSRTAAVVDPVEPKKVLDLVQAQNVNLTTVLTTHHHWDHAGGNKELLAAMPNLRVLGGDKRIDAVTQIVAHSDKFELGKLNVECLFTPCHTQGHICYQVSAPSSDDVAIFTGDTLFIAGCGKFFEGTADQMYNALVKIIGSLPDQVKVYCGHEYTVSNLKFASQVEPNNVHIKEKMDFALKCRAESVPTVPSTVGQEKLYNPFMRVGEATVQQHVKQVGDAVATMAALRNEKNNFRA